MKRTMICGMLVALAGSLMIGATMQAEPAAEKGPKVGKLRHVGLFKFKDDATKQQVQEIENAFRALPSKIPTIVDYEWGTNNSPEGLADGFTHCFFLTFKNAEGRAVYLPHPAHKAFGKVLHPHLDKVLVIDYIVKD